MGLEPPFLFFSRLHPLFAAPAALSLDFDGTLSPGVFAFLLSFGYVFLSLPQSETGGFFPSCMHPMMFLSLCW